MLYFYKLIINHSFKLTCFYLPIFLNLSTGSSGGRVIGHELTNSSAEKNSDEPNYFNAAGSRTNSRSFLQKKRGASNSKTTAASKKGRKEQPVQSQNLEEDDEEDSDSESDDYFEP